MAGDFQEFLLFRVTNYKNRKFTVVVDVAEGVKVKAKGNSIEQAEIRATRKALKMYPDQHSKLKYGTQRRIIDPNVMNQIMKLQRMSSLTSGSMHSEDSTSSSEFNKDSPCTSGSMSSEDSASSSEFNKDSPRTSGSMSSEDSASSSVFSEDLPRGKKNKYSQNEYSGSTASSPSSLSSYSPVTCRSEERSPSKVISEISNDKIVNESLIENHESSQTVQNKEYVNVNNNIEVQSPPKLPIKLKLKRLARNMAEMYVQSEKKSTNLMGVSEYSEILDKAFMSNLSSHQQSPCKGNETSHDHRKGDSLIEQTAVHKIEVVSEQSEMDKNLLSTIEVPLSNGRVEMKDSLNEQDTSSEAVFPFNDFSGWNKASIQLEFRNPSPQPSDESSDEEYIVLSLYSGEDYNSPLELSNSDLVAILNDFRRLSLSEQPLSYAKRLAYVSDMGISMKPQNICRTVSQNNIILPSKFSIPSKLLEKPILPSHPPSAKKSSRKSMNGSKKRELKKQTNPSQLLSVSKRSRKVTKNNIAKERKKLLNIAEIIIPREYVKRNIITRFQMKLRRSSVLPSALPTQSCKNVMEQTMESNFSKSEPIIQPQSPAKEKVILIGSKHRNPIVLVEKLDMALLQRGDKETEGELFSPKPPVLLPQIKAPWPSRKSIFPYPPILKPQINLTDNEGTPIAELRFLNPFVVIEEFDMSLLQKRKRNHILSTSMSEP